MSSIRHQREQEKIKLLAQIQQQRLNLSDESATWLSCATLFDYSNKVSLRWYKSLFISLSILSLYQIARHPRRSLRYSRRFITLWKIFKLLRHAFYR